MISSDVFIPYDPKLKNIKHERRMFTILYFMMRQNSLIFIPNAQPCKLTSILTIFKKLSIPRKISLYKGTEIFNGIFFFQKGIKLKDGLIVGEN